jgi:acetyl-CoA carboxylase carboxyl transferase subunit alpha
MSSGYRLAFERPIYDLEGRIAEADAAARDNPAAREDLRRLRRELVETTKKIFSQLTAWEIVEVARHPDRPMTTDYIDLIFDEFVELHGDKSFGDDRAIRTGFAKLDQFKVMIVGHQKGRTVKERSLCHFGCAHPEGYRKALRLMRLAQKFGMTVISLIDTPGAFPGIGSEERHISEAIAVNLREMMSLRVPIIAVVIGEGGSGGALGIGVADRVLILENAYYSVISPEACSAILWRDRRHAAEAAEALKLTAQDLLRLDVVDEIVPEPEGGAHRDYETAAANLGHALRENLARLRELSIDELVRKRYAKFRAIGSFAAGKTVTPTPRS